MSLNESSRRLLGVQEVARTLGLSQRAVWALLSTGELPSFKLKRRRLVDSVDLDLYIASLKEAS